jgi:hypothetical protein
MRTRRRVLAAKFEATEGTAETVGASDGGILVIDPKIDVDIKMTERPLARPTLGTYAAVAGARSARLTFKTELKGTGTTYTVNSTTKPAISKYLEACSYLATYGSGAIAAWAYTPTSGTGASLYVPSLTMALWEDGVKKQLRGCRGNVRFSGNVGEPIYAEFDFQGVWDSSNLADESNPSPTFETQTPPVLLSANASAYNYANVFASFTLDSGNTLALRDSMNSVDGYLSAIVTQRKLSGTIGMEMTTLATKDWFGAWKNSTNIPIIIGNVSGGSGNVIKFLMPKARIKKLTDTDRNGIAALDMQFDLEETATDDEVTIYFLPS